MLPRFSAGAAGDIAAVMFAQTAGGPHAAAGVVVVGDRPTVTEIELLQAAVLFAIGEKGSAKRKLADSLALDGWIDLEVALGHILCAYFGRPPQPVKEAREIAKRAVGKLANKSDKEKWKGEARRAREIVNKETGNAERASAAAQEAKARAMAAFGATEVPHTVWGTGESYLASTNPASAPAPDELLAPPRDVHGSLSAALAIFSGYYAMQNGVDCDHLDDPDYDTDRPHASGASAIHRASAWACYMSALRKLRDEYPEVVCCDSFDVGGCMHTRECPGCGGRLGAWPWVLRRDLCCECDYAFDERQEWTGEHEEAAAELLRAENRMRVRGMSLSDEALAIRHPQPYTVYAYSREYDGYI